MIRKLFKFFIGSSLLMALITVGLWFFYAKDEELSPEFEEFFAGYDEPVADEDNIAYWINGLNAPEDVEDFYEWGKQNAKENEKDYHELSKGNNADSNDESEKNEAYKKDYKSLKCYQNLAAISVKDKKECPSDEEIKQYIADNELLLSRYEKIISQEVKGYRNYIGSRKQNFIFATRLYNLKLIMQAKDGDVEEALKKWQKGFVFNQELLAEELNSTDLVVYFVTFGDYLKTFPVIYQLTGINRQEITANIIPILDKSIERFASLKEEILRGMLRKEFYMYNSFYTHFLSAKTGGGELKTWSDIMLPDENRLKNRYLEYYKEAMKLADIPASELDKSIDNLQNKFKPEFLDRYMLADSLINGMSHGLELLEAYYSKLSYLKKVRLMVEIYRRGEPLYMIAETMEYIPEEMRTSPYDDRLFGFDESRLTIYDKYEREQREGGLSFNDIRLYFHEAYSKGFMNHDK